MSLICQKHKCVLQHNLNQENKIEVETCYKCLADTDNEAYQLGVCDGYHQAEDENFKGEK